MTKALKSGIVTCLLTGLLACSGVSDARKSITATAGSVTSTGKMSTPRAGHTATLLPNGKVLIVGGMERDGVFFATAELYDSATGRFTPTGSMRPSVSARKQYFFRTEKF